MDVIASSIEIVAVELNWQAEEKAFGFQLTFGAYDAITQDSHSTRDASWSDYPRE